MCFSWLLIINCFPLNNQCWNCVLSSTVGPFLQRKIIVVLVTTNECQENTAAAPKAPHQGLLITTKHCREATAAAPKAPHQGLLITTNDCQEATTAAPKAPHQGHKLNTMVHIMVEAPDEGTVIGAIAPTAEVLKHMWRLGKLTSLWIRNFGNVFWKGTFLNVNVGYVVPWDLTEMETWGFEFWVVLSWTILMVII
jgi:hypothetical protein